MSFFFGFFFGLEFVVCLFVRPPLLPYLFFLATLFESSLSIFSFGNNIQQKSDGSAQWTKKKRCERLLLNSELPSPPSNFVRSVQENDEDPHFF